MFRLNWNCHHKQAVQVTSPARSDTNHESVIGFFSECFIDQNMAWMERRSQTHQADTQREIKTETWSHFIPALREYDPVMEFSCSSAIQDSWAECVWDGFVRVCSRSCVCVCGTAWNESVMIVNSCSASSRTALLKPPTGVPKAWLVQHVYPEEPFFTCLVSKIKSHTPTKLELPLYCRQ